MRTESLAFCTVSIDVLCVLYAYPFERFLVRLCRDICRWTQATLVHSQLSDATNIFAATRCTQRVVVYRVHRGGRWRPAARVKCFAA